MAPTNSRMVIHSDWGELNINSPGAKLVVQMDEIDPPPAKDSLKLTPAKNPNKLHWGTERKFGDVKIPFTLENAGRDVDFSTSHGRDRKKHEDHDGEVDVWVGSQPAFRNKTDTDEDDQTSTSFTAKLK
ncbi:hypothetical protein LQW54_012358 [Pestalotiopsis sp. IQ-011]